MSIIKRIKAERELFKEVVEVIKDKDINKKKIGVIGDDDFYFSYLFASSMLTKEIQILGTKQQSMLLDLLKSFGGLERKIYINDFVSSKEFYNCKNVNTSFCAFARLIYSSLSNKEEYIYSKEEEKINHLIHDTIIKSDIESAVKLCEIWKQEVIKRVFINKVPNRGKADYIAGIKNKNILPNFNAVYELPHFYKLKNLREIIGFRELRKIEVINSLKVDINSFLKGKDIIFINMLKNGVSTSLIENIIKTVNIKDTKVFILCYYYDNPKAKMIWYKRLPRDEDKRRLNDNRGYYTYRLLEVVK
jgi:hypothetical protein